MTNEEKSVDNSITLGSGQNLGKSDAMSKPIMMRKKPPAKKTVNFGDDVGSQVQAPQMSAQTLS